MDAKISIYLAGTIQKAHERANESFWTNEDLLFLQKKLPEYEIFFLNPAFRTDNLSDQRSVFGRDMTQVFCSDLVFVDARDRRGLGVGAEMMWAKFHQIPVVTLAPHESHYHKSRTTLLGVTVEDYVHPFVASLSDGIVEHLTEGAEWIRRCMNGVVPEIKGLESIESAMHYYRDHQLAQDGPMKELLAANHRLHQRVMELKKVGLV